MNLAQHIVRTLAIAVRGALAAGALLAVTACAARPPVCTLARIAVAPDGAGGYAGRGGRVELRLRDDRPDAAVASFPESDLEIRAGSTVCVAPGGVWTRQALFAAADGRTVVALESSGSADALVFFDSASCRRVATVDVSDGGWTVEGGAVVWRPAAPGRSAVRHALDASCRPSHPR